MFLFSDCKQVRRAVSPSHERALKLLRARWHIMSSWSSERLGLGAHFDTAGELSHANWASLQASHAKPASLRARESTIRSVCFPLIGLPHFSGAPFGARLTVDLANLVLQHRAASRISAAARELLCLRRQDYALWIICKAWRRHRQRVAACHTDPPNHGSAWTYTAMFCYAPPYETNIFHVTDAWPVPHEMNRRPGRRTSNRSVAELTSVPPQLVWGAEAGAAMEEVE